jgi:hypothetical protein
MWPFKKKKPEELTYEEEHNKAFNAYKKSSQIGIWGGVLNVLGLLIAIAQISEMKFLNLFLCYGSTNFFIDLMMLNTSLAASPWFYIIGFAIAMALSAVFILLSVFASQGKKIPLILSVVLYFIDLCFVFPLGLLGFENVGTLWLNVAVHVIILGFLFIALYQYVKIIKIAIKYGILKEEREENLNENV